MLFDCLNLWGDGLAKDGDEEKMHIQYIKAASSVELIGDDEIKYKSHDRNKKSFLKRMISKFKD